MFNDLENPNNSTPDTPATNAPSASVPVSAPPQNLPVDDIFAETDKAPESNHRGGAEIEAKKVGLVAEKEKLELDEVKKEGKKSFKILITIIVIVIVALLGYLVYDRFFSAGPVIDANTPVGQQDTPPTVDNISDITPPTQEPETDDTADSEPVTEEDNSPLEPVFVPVIDSDSDGLTDDEEIIAGTNINIIDTDNDGISDYEELKIYKSNPLNSDSDADGYQDGEEIRNGYNPNGDGRLSDTAK